MPLPSITDIRYFEIVLDELCRQPTLPLTFWTALIVHAFLKYIKGESEEEIENVLRTIDDEEAAYERPKNGHALSFNEIREILSLLPTRTLDPKPSHAHFRLMISRAMKVAALLQVSHFSRQAEAKVREAFSKLGPFEVAIVLFIVYHMCKIERSLTQHFES